MNNIKSLMSVVFLTGALGLSAVSAGAEGVISQDVLTDGSYCHTKFESIREDTLASSQPVLKDADDIVDFYGACNHVSGGRRRFSLRSLRCSTGSRASTTIEDFLIRSSQRQQTVPVASGGHRSSAHRRESRNGSSGINSD